MEQKYEITILNWDKYQREMKGGENRRRSRDWIALSTDLLHDPDLVELTVEQRWLWVAMLLHAGRVGPVYKLSISSARLLFKLRAGWRGVVDFEVLKNQGFIKFRAATNKTNKTNKTNTSANEKKKKKSTSKTATRFDDFWAAYPSKKSKPQALKVWGRDNLDLLADKIIAHVEKRKVGDEQWMKDGGRFIPHPSTFLNNQKWEDEWEPIITTIPIKYRKPEVLTDEQRRRDVEKADRELAALQEQQK